MDDHAIDLDSVLLEFEAAVEAYVARDDHLLADAVLHGYAIDVIDQVRAVLVVQRSDAPRAAYANARAAFEAAGDMLLLVSAPGNYDELGALAYAIEIVETDELRGRFLAADETFNLSEPAPDSMTPEQVIDEDAKVADSISPGRGVLLRNALVEARKPRRSKQHWSALSRKQMLDELGRRLPSIEGLAAAGDAFYGFASVHTHPRLRAWAQPRSRGDGGELTVERRDVDSSFPTALAFIATKLAGLALRIRDGEVEISEASA